MLHFLLHFFISKITYIFRFSCLFLFFLLSLGYSFAQNITINGVVLDERTKEPLPFVNIDVNDGQLGATTDLDGKFLITVESNTLKKIVFVYVGYDKFTYKVKQSDDLKPLQKPLRILLTENPDQMKEVVIFAGENPAHKIIRQAIKNRDKNNPTKLKSYQYKAYYKALFTAESPTKTIQISPNDTMKVDSSDLKMEDYLKKHHLFLTENISIKKYLASNRYKEEVIANRFSGLKKAPFAFGSTNTEPFSFYQDFVGILGKDYLSPLAIGSIDKYDFSLEQTLLQKPDTIFVISFSPRKTKNILGLSGVMYVHSKGFGLQSIRLSSIPEDENFISFKLQQYAELQQKDDVKIWFPVQLNSEYLFKNFNLVEKKVNNKIVEKRHSILAGRTYIKDIMLNPPLNKREFTDEMQVISDSAHIAKDSTWRSMQLEKLDKKDENTYKYLDSLGNKYQADKWLNVAEKFVLNRIGLNSYLDLNIKQMLRFNRYEGLRIGFAIQSSDKLMQKWAIFGKPFFWSTYIGYGTKDGNFKYGISTQLDLKHRLGWQIGFDAVKDIEEPAQAHYFAPDALFSSGTARLLLAERMDKMHKLEVFTKVRPIRNHQLYLFASRIQYQPAYDYTFVRNLEDLQNIENQHFYQFFEIGAKWHYARGQNYTRRLGQRILLTYDVPVFNVNVTQGLSAFGGDYSYTRIEGQAEYKYKFRYAGTTQAIIKTGVLFGDVPYMRQMHAPSTTSRFPAWVKGYLQTADLYQFLTDRYVGVFLSHYFGHLLYKSKSKTFQPELSFHHNMFWGDMSSPTFQLGFDFQVPKDIFWESGILVDKLYRIEMANIGYFNYGIGIFAKYGHYAEQDWRSNFAYKMSFGFEF